MKTHLKLWFILFLLIALLEASAAMTIPSAKAQEGYSKYVWEKSWVVSDDLPPAGEQIMCELHIEIAKMLNQCCSEQVTPRHLGPYYVGQGYLTEDLFWLNPGETVLVLAEALEFLPPEQQREVVRYLKFEMQSSFFSPLAYSIEPGIPSPLLARESYRSFGPPLPNELAPPAVSERLTARPENLYAAWAFAHYVSQFENPADTPSAWQIINANWPKIESLYSQIPSKPGTYWQAMGAIGYARMAKQLGKPFDQAEQRAQVGLSAGKNYSQFYTNMGTDVGCFGNNGNLDGWEGVWDYCAFSAAQPQVLYDTKNNHQGYAGEYLANRPSMFAAEIGRFLHDNAQSQVQNHLNRYLAPTGQAYFPFWWENRGTKPWAVRDDNTSPPGNGENAIIHPSFPWQLFMLRATVFPGETGDSMKLFLDTPSAIGDVFHIQKLVTLLRMYSTIQWAETDPQPGYSQVTACLDGSLSPGPLSYGKSASPLGADEGETVTYVLSITRHGEPITSTTWLTDILPSQLNFVPHSLTSNLGFATYKDKQVNWSGVISTADQVNISYQMTIPISLPLVVDNLATFYNPDFNTIPVLRSAQVLLNGKEVHLPAIMKR